MRGYVGEGRVGTPGAMRRLSDNQCHLVVGQDKDRISADGELVFPRCSDWKMYKSGQTIDSREDCLEFSSLHTHHVKTSRDVAAVLKIILMMSTRRNVKPLKSHRENRLFKIYQIRGVSCVSTTAESKLSRDI